MTKFELLLLFTAALACAFGIGLLLGEATGVYWEFFAIPLGLVFGCLCAVVQNAVELARRTR